MKFRIRELTPGYRLEVCVPTCVSWPPSCAGAVAETWIPVGHPYGTKQSARLVAEEFARAGQIVEEFHVEPCAAART